LLFAVIIAVLPEMFGKIGRLPAIKEWLSLIFCQKFPYYATTTPSGFPMLFFLAIPFYITGLLKFFVLCGLILFSFIAVKTHSSAKELTLQFILLFISPIFLYDLLVKSELFLNMMLPIALLYFINKYYNKRISQVLFFGTLAGLILSTRSTVAIVYILFFIPFFRKDLGNLLLFGAAALLTFMLTLLPFIIWDSTGFIQKGPFAIQSFLSYLPTYIVAVFILAVFFISFKINNLQSFFLGTGLLLFFIVIFSYGIKTWEFGWYEALINDKIDLSYLDFCVPFLIFSCKENNNYNFSKQSLLS
jgi:hypothetical protein